MNQIIETLANISKEFPSSDENCLGERGDVYIANVDVKPPDVIEIVLEACGQFDIDANRLSENQWMEIQDHVSSSIGNCLVLISKTIWLDSESSNAVEVVTAAADCLQAKYRYVVAILEGSQA